MTAMMRARRVGGSCQVAGHGAWCEVSQERARRGRAQERREWQRAVDRGDT